MNETLVNVLGAECERLTTEIMKCVMRRLLKEEKARESGSLESTVSMDPFDRENRPKLLEIIQEFGKLPGEEKPLEEDELIHAALATLVSLRLLSSLEPDALLKQRRYALTDRGRSITHLWFKSNGGAPFDPQEANIKLAQKGSKQKKKLEKN